METLQNPVCWGLKNRKKEN